VNFYARHIGDYLKDTAHLSLLHHGIYARLLDVYYTREAGFAEGEAHRLIGARTRDERKATDEVLAEFFKLADGVWVQGRCDEEIAAYKHKQELAKRSADARWARSGRNANASASGDAEPMRTHSDGNAPNPNPIPKEKENAATPLPDWLPSKEWADFLAHRKAMRGVPFTDAARAGVIRDLDKLRAKGYSPADLLSTAITRGWRTVFEPKVNLAAPGDVARVTVPGPPPSSFLAEQAAHRAQVEAERIARKAKQTTGAH
jgi:uncharacterized protein YdaU (DUF1376 family)